MSGTAEILRPLAGSKRSLKRAVRKGDVSMDTQKSQTFNLIYKYLYQNLYTARKERRSDTLLELVRSLKNKQFAQTKLLVGFPRFFVISSTQSPGTKKVATTASPCRRRLMTERRQISRQVRNIASNRLIPAIGQTIESLETLRVKMPFRDSLESTLENGFEARRASQHKGTERIKAFP